MPPASAKRARLQVIKKPLDYVPIIHTPNFPKMPILYMELLENKKKVAPELRNKEYIPKETTSTISPLHEAERSTIPEKFRLDEEKSFDSGDKSGAKPVKEGKGKKKRISDVFFLLSTGIEPGPTACDAIFLSITLLRCYICREKYENI